MVKWQYTPFEIELFFSKLNRNTFEIFKQTVNDHFRLLKRAYLEKKTELNKIWKRKMFIICRAYMGIEK